MSRNRSLLLAARGLLLAAGPAAAAGYPGCAGEVEISRAKVVRVEQNGVLVLADGRALALEGIRLPMGEADHAPARLADEARATLLSLARQGTVTGTALAPKQDRYDRVRVQGFTETQWLQRSLLEQGLARVTMAPDRGECANELFGFEAQARQGGRGIWANPTYRIRNDHDDWRPDIGTFQLIEGKVVRVGAQGGATTLDFSTDGRTGLLVSIADRRNFRGADIEALAGKRLRVRGIVQDSNGRPMIAVSGPAQIEVVN